MTGEGPIKKQAFIEIAPEAAEPLWDARYDEAWNAPCQSAAPGYRSCRQHECLRQKEVVEVSNPGNGEAFPADEGKLGWGEKTTVQALKWESRDLPKFILHRF